MSDSGDLMDCSPSDSSVHGISQARILEWVAISFFRGSSPPRDQTPVTLIVDVSSIAGRFVNIKPPGKPPQYQYLLLNLVNFKIKDKRLSLASFIVWTLTFIFSFLSLAKC